MNKLFAEYFDVLNREKFNRFPDFHIRAQVLLADIESRSLKFEPTKTVNMISDEADNRLGNLLKLAAQITW